MKKDITFIYSDAAEKSMYLPIMEEAKRRGYKVRLTADKFARCEIGFYCQHINHPQFSKFSVVLLHDIIQQHGNWPDIWLREPWNKYDIGILPSEQWVGNWQQCSQWYYARPRVGMFKVGWPKADAVASLVDDDTARTAFAKEFGLVPELPTVLYAPSWENDGKQDDFVQAALNLDVNILVKHADVDSNVFPEYVAEVERMAKLHQGNSRVTLLPPAMNIFEAIAASDILVSEESSTMCEAVMMGKPAIAVTNWLIPDVTPSRYPTCDYDFVIKTTKENLQATLEEVVADYGKYQAQAAEYSKLNFSNIGHSSQIIMDIVDDCVSGREMRHGPLAPKPVAKVPVVRSIKHRLIALKRETSSNYSKRNPLVGIAWRAAKQAKNALQRD